MFEHPIVTNAIENSSNILRSGYSYDHQIMEVEFKGGARYRYKNVPEDVYHAFWQAESKGSFLASKIKGVYEVEKYEPKKEEISENSTCD